MSGGNPRRVVRVEIPIESDGELEALKGALLAARATELSKKRRRNDRLSFGYGTDSAREVMGAEVDQAEQRWTMLDRLLMALGESTPNETD
jgi:hypothetical protein